MRFLLTKDAAEFAARVERFLSERVERNVLATVLAQVRGGSYTSPGALFAAGLDGDGKVAAAALRTPPWPLLVSELEDCGAAGRLLEPWLREDPELPGVVALAATARAVAAAWRSRTGGSSSCYMREAMHVLARLRDPARPADGRLRPAGERERELLIEWERAFMTEAGVGVAEEAERIVSVRLAAGTQYVWEDGEPVSTLGLSPRIAGTVRIGPVYTPPQWRNHGFASSAVAQASRVALAGGADRCILFTDLANPTSNKIYANLGFERFAEYEEHTLIRREP